MAEASTGRDLLLPDALDGDASEFARKMAATVNATMSMTVKMMKALCAKVEELQAQLAARDAELAALREENAKLKLAAETRPTALEVDQEQQAGAPRELTAPWL